MPMAMVLLRAAELWHEHCSPGQAGASGSSGASPPLAREQRGSSSEGGQAPLLPQLLLYQLGNKFYLKHSGGGRLMRDAADAVMQLAAHLADPTQTPLSPAPPAGAFSPGAAHVLLGSPLVCGEVPQPQKTGPVFQAADRLAAVGKRFLEAQQARLLESMLVSLRM